MRSTRLILATLIVGAAAISTWGADHSSNSPAAQDLKKFQVAPGLKVGLFASEPLLQNPVCFSIDGQGRFFVVETHRYRNAIFDITANTPWLLDDLSFRTVNDRAAFLARTFATNFAVLTNDSEIIRLVEDRDGDGSAEVSSVFADGFNESVAGTAAGVLAQGTNVWFTCIPDLRGFTIHDSRFTIQSSVAALRQSSELVNRKSNIVNRLATGLGVHISVSGHDVHGLIRGHDGRIYFSFGDRGVCVTNREGVVLNVPDTGGVLRCEPDGRNMEIFCIGLRNPQELAFDDYGNLWTVDNDTAGADPCRVLHLVEGGDYGWRMSYQHMKGFGPWVQEELWRGGLDGILPPAGTVSQGPAGLAFYPGTGSTPQLAGKFVHADFPGGVWAYSVKPRGASYEIADKEKLLWNCWPTDVDFGPDGALYVLDWVQGWTPPGKGRIYRLTSNAELGTRNAERVAEVKRLLGEGMNKRSEKELLTLLGHADRRVRLEAQWELAGRGTAVVPGLLKLARTGRSDVSRLHALWALGMHWRQHPPPGRRRSGDVVFDQILELTTLLKDAREIVRVDAADVLGELRFLNADLPTKQMMEESSLVVRSAGVRAQGNILSGFGDSLPVRERISRLERWRDVLDHELGKQIRGSSMRHPGAEIGKLSADVRSNDPFVVHELTRFYEVDAGRHLRANLPAGIVYTNHFLNLGTNLPARLAGVLAYRRMGYGGLTNFVSDSNPRVVLEMARAINDSPIPAATPELAALLDDPRFRDPNWGWSALSNVTPAGPFSTNVRPPREQVLRRALNAHFRLGQPTNVAAMVRFALGAPIPPSLRAEALFLLGAWEVLPAEVGDLPIEPAKDPNHGSTPTVNPENWPGWFDRVVGLYRPLPPRSAESARSALGPVIASLVADESSEVALAALEVAIKLRLSNAAPALLARLRDTNSPVSIRRKVPEALAVVGPERLSEAVQVALDDSSADLRASALPFLDRLDSDKAADILSRIVAGKFSRVRTEAPPSGELALAQGALRVLGGLKNSAADATLRSALTNLLEARLSSALELDLVEAASRRDDPAIKALLARRESVVANTNGLGKWQTTLRGGNAERGRAIFFEKAETQCSRCHQVKGEGGIVGPALDKIARQRNREYLLEAIVFPNKAIASGFENVVLTLKNGTSPAGVVKSEDAASLRLDSPEEGPMTIAKPDIVERRRGLSAMPEETAQQLSLRELRDLVEFLATLK